MELAGSASSELVFEKEIVFTNDTEASDDKPNKLKVTTGVIDGLPALYFNLPVEHQLLGNSDLASLNYSELGQSNLSVNEKAQVKIAAELITDFGKLFIGKGSKLESAKKIELKILSGIDGQGELVAGSGTILFANEKIKLGELRTAAGQVYVQSKEGIAVDSLQLSGGDAYLDAPALQLSELKGIGELTLRCDQLPKNLDRLMSQTNNLRLLNIDRSKLDNLLEYESSRSGELANYRQLSLEGFQGLEVLELRAPVKIPKNLTLVVKGINNHQTLTVGGDFYFKTELGLNNLPGGSVKVEGNWYLDSSKEIKNQGTIEVLKDAYLKGSAFKLLAGSNFRVGGDFYGQFSGEGVSDQKATPKSSAFKRFFFSKFTRERTSTQKTINIVGGALLSASGSNGINLLAEQGDIYIEPNQQLNDHLATGSCSASRFIRDRHRSANVSMPEFQSSKIISHHGPVNLSAANGRIYANGAEVSAGAGDIVLYGRYGVDRTDIVRSYLDRYDCVVVGEHRHKPKFHRRSIDPVYGLEPVRQTVKFKPKFNAPQGNIILDAPEGKVKFMGDAFAGKKIVLKGGQGVEILASRQWANRHDSPSTEELRGFLAGSGVAEMLPMPLGDDDYHPAAFNFVGSILLAGEGIEVWSNQDIELVAPIFLSKDGPINIISEHGQIRGSAMLGNYLKELGPNRVTYALTGKSGVIAALGGDVNIAAYDGRVEFKGFSFGVDADHKIKLYGKEGVELGTSTETVTQYRKDTKRKLFSKSIRETWENESLSIPVSILGASELASDKEVILSGTKAAGSMTVELGEEGELLLKAHQVRHDRVERVENCGFSMPFIPRARAKEHDSLADTIINEIPLLTATHNLLKMHSATDLAPLIVFGATVIDALSATSAEELLAAQLGITLINGIPVPSSVGWCEQRLDLKSSEASSIPTEINLGAEKFSMRGKRMMVEGSSIIGEAGQVYISVADFIHQPAAGLAESSYGLHENEYGATLGKLGVTYRGGEGEGTEQIQGLNHGAIMAKVFELYTDNAKIKSPIITEQAKIKITNDLLIETLQEIRATKDRYFSAGGGVSLNNLPSVSIGGSSGEGESRWARIPSYLAGEELYLEVGGECRLVGGGIIGKQGFLKAHRLTWEEVKNEDNYDRRSYGFDSGILTAGANLGRSFNYDWSLNNGRILGRDAGSLIKGLASVGFASSSQFGVIRPTISSGIELEVADSSDQDYSTLNRDPDRMIEVGKRSERVISVAVPLLNISELKECWGNRETLIQQQLSSGKDQNGTDLSLADQELLKKEQEVIGYLKEEAIDHGFTPEEVETEVTNLVAESYLAENILRLADYYQDDEVPSSDLLLALQGEYPSLVEKDSGVELEFVKAPSKIASEGFFEWLSEWMIYHEAAELKRDALNGEVLIPFLGVVNRYSGVYELLDQKIPTKKGPIDTTELATDIAVEGILVKIVGPAGKGAAPAVKSFIKGSSKAIKASINKIVQVSFAKNGAVLVEKRAAKGLWVKVDSSKEVKQILNSLGYQEHHLIPQQVVARHELFTVEKVVFDKDQALNKIFLPSSADPLNTGFTWHSGRHSKVATRRVEDQLDRILKTSQTEGWLFQEQYEQALRQVMDMERTALESGSVFLNRVIGPKQ